MTRARERKENDPALLSGLSGRKRPLTVECVGSNGRERAASPEGPLMAPKICHLFQGRRNGTVICLAAPYPSCQKQV